MLLNTSKTVIFIDGPNTYNVSKALDYNIDYRKLHTLLEKYYPNIVRKLYFAAVDEDVEYQSIKPLLDWMAYNGWTVVSKPTKNFIDSQGRKKIKGNMDIELAVSMMELAPKLDQVVLFSGDGDFKPLVEAVQRIGCRVDVWSTVKSSPAMCSDELRRQADRFVDMDDDGIVKLISRPDSDKQKARNLREGRENQELAQE